MTSKTSRPFVIGLTGGIGAGKSTAADFFRKQNIPVINADELAHQALAPQSSTHQKIIKIFGKKILDQTGQINRADLAKEVFGNIKKLKRLENIIHPFVRAQTEVKLKNYARQKYALVVLDVPLLFESNFDQLCDTTISISAPKTQTIRRLQQTRGWSRSEALRRMLAQLTQREKNQRADFVVFNNSSQTTFLRNLRYLLIKSINPLATAKKRF